jgi:formylglycine-generating enzyme required for sulfatase activity
VSTERDQDLPPTATESAPLTAGARVGRYLILGRVGSGAMGVVYGAYDPELDRRIALKLLNGEARGHDLAARARLLREAKAMARVEHPNVIAVHDVGVFEERVFLAMEFLAGGTLREWLEDGPRGWREVLAAFLDAGRGLAAAHAAGLVHRDFKPENVLLDKDGRPRVVDFGLAREAAPPDDGKPVASVASYVTAVPALAAANPLETLTRTGAVMGTPAYMAPEQFLGEPTDARTDQFSFCVALHEALYGERPFAGDSVLSLLRNVMDGTLQPLAAERDVPAWIRRVLARGLAAERSERWPSMAALIAALEDDPRVRQRRRVLSSVALVTALAGVLGVTHAVRQRHEQLELRLAAPLAEAVRSSDVGRAQARELRDLRRRAFAAFDTPDRARGESLWKEALAMIPSVDAAYDRAESAYETALVLDPTRAELRARLADLIREQLLISEEQRRPERVRALAARLERYDDDGTRRLALAAPGKVTVHTRPAASVIALERYERDPERGRRWPRPVALPPGGEAAPLTLPAGSYRLSARAPGRAEVIYPFELGRGEPLAIDLGLPAAAEIPSGFAYVPAGALWFGDADEQMRTGFLGAVPIHRRRTGAYLIARHEVTYAEWIAFLDSLPAEERARRAPNVSTALRGSLTLREESEEGQRHWQLTFRPTSERYAARDGEPLVYHGRTLRAEQDWSRMPVGGISLADARRYLEWLRASGRVPRARLCTELEWERAARGADDRLYPHGDDLQPDEADFDQTYGRVDSAYGPDAVGSHPASRSPFGIDDMAGNLFELVASSDKAGEMAVRGGAYYFSSYTCRVTNREVVPAGLHDMTMGLRVCASIDEEDANADR